MRDGVEEQECADLIGAGILPLRIISAIGDQFPCLPIDMANEPPLRTGLFLLTVPIARTLVDVRYPVLDQSRLMRYRHTCFDRFTIKV